MQYTDRAHHEEKKSAGPKSARPNGHVGDSPRFPFDRAEAERFLALLDAEAEAFLFAVGDDDKERRKKLIAEAKASKRAPPVLWVHRRSSIEQAGGWLGQSQQKGWGVFVSVQAMNAAKCQIGELTYIRVVYGEMDIGQPLQPWPIEPSIIVESSPGRYHVYWLVLADDPINADDFHGVMMRLVETYGSDPDAKDLARRLRLPGTWNLKPGREPHRVRVVGGAGARYTRDELLNAFPPPPRRDPKPSGPRPKLNGRAPPGLTRFTEALSAISPDNYGDWLRVGMALHAETGGGDDGLALWDHWSAGSEKWALGDCAEKWRSFGTGRGLGGGTIFFMAEERGWIKPTRSTNAASKHKANGGPTPGAQECHDDAGAWPDPVQLPQGLLPVAPFDYDMLPEKVRPWVEDICERMQCPADFVAVSVMAALGSLIGRKVMVRPKREDSWSEVPNQWALLIGRPGVMKSPAIEEALWPVKVLAKAARERFELAMAEYEAKSAAGQARDKNAQKEVLKRLAKDKSAAIEDLLKPQPGEEEPTLQRYIATNASYEALAVLLQQNPQGLLVHRDEMLSFLDRLAEEGHADERGFYLTGWAGNSAYTFDRIGRGLDLHIDAVCLSLLGSTQPGRISKYIVDVLRGGRGDDGLMQRFGLMVWPDIPATWKNVDRKPNVEARTEAFAVFKALDNLDWKAVHAQRDLGADERVVGLPWLRFSEAANERFVAWLTRLELRLRGHEELALESHLAKYRKLVPGLGLICHLADGTKGEVSDAAVEKALKWAVYLETHAARTYASTTIAAADAARAIIGKVKSGHLKMQFAPREIVRAQWSRLKGSDTIQRALQLLEDHDWLTINKVVTGGRPGTVCNMNPKAMAFAKTHLGGN